MRLARRRRESQSREGDRAPVAAPSSGELQFKLRTASGLQEQSALLSPRLAAAEGLRGQGGPLPYADRIQQSFGHHDVSGVSAHIGGAAAVATEQLGAEAYAHAGKVAFGGSPTLHTAAHEAAHVVQQRSGLQLPGGRGQVGDAYERHADAVADRVVAGESAEALLDQVASPGRAGHSASVQLRDSEQAALRKRFPGFQIAARNRLGRLSDEVDPALTDKLAANAEFRALPVRVQVGAILAVLQADASKREALLRRMVSGDRDLFVQLSRLGKAHRTAGQRVSSGFLGTLDDVDLGSSRSRVEGQDNSDAKTRVRDAVEEVIEGILDEIADPTRITQGGMSDTCAVASAQFMLVSTDPGTYVSLLLDLVQRGHCQVGETKVTLDGVAQWKDDDKGGESYASYLFQKALLQAYGGEHRGTGAGSTMRMHQDLMSQGFGGALIRRYPLEEPERRRIEQGKLKLVERGAIAKVIDACGPDVLYPMGATFSARHAVVFTGVRRDIETGETRYHWWDPSMDPESDAELGQEYASFRIESAEERRYSLNAADILRIVDYILVPPHLLPQ